MLNEVCILVARDEVYPRQVGGGYSGPLGARISAAAPAALSRSPLPLKVMVRAAAMPRATVVCRSWPQMWRTPGVWDL